MIYVHLCLAELYSNLSKHLHDLTVNLRQSTGTTKRHYCTHDLERRNLSVVVHSNPQTVALSWSAACERIGLLSENGIQHWPNDCRQLQTAAELFRMLPVWTVGHLRQELGTTSAAKCKDIAFQLCEMFPVVSIVHRRERRDGIGKTLDTSTYLIDISSVEGCMYLWSLLCNDAGNGESEQIEMHVDGQDSDVEVPVQKKRARGTCRRV